MDKFSNLFRVFLLRYLDVEYEFTEDELFQELNKKKINKALRDRIIGLSNLISDIKYKGKKIDGKEFNYMLNEAAEIINVATGTGTEVTPENTDKKSGLKLFIGKIIQSGKGGQKSQEIAEHPKKTVNANEIGKKSNNYILPWHSTPNFIKYQDAILASIKAHNLNDLKNAKIGYAKAREMYIKLSFDEKKEAYGSLMDLYEKLR